MLTGCEHTHPVLDYVDLVHWEVHMDGPDQILSNQGLYAAAPHICQRHEAPSVSCGSPAAFLQLGCRLLHQRLRRC